MASPTLETWLPQAKEANPTVSEEALTSYFDQKYGPPPSSLPTLQSWLPQARKANPETDDTALTEYWQGKYGAHGAKEKESTQGDVARGFKDDFKQLPQLGYGLVGAAGAAAESVVGEGGIATGIKKFGVKGYEEKGKEIAADSKPTDSFNYAYDRAKDGDLGALVDWAQYSLGHAGAQGIQALSSVLLGGPAGPAVMAGGKAALGPLATTFVEKLVAKESARLATTDAAKGLASEELTRLATANVAKNIGQKTALALQATGMEGGEIGGDLAAKSVEENRTLSGEELAKGFGATIGAGALEFVGDKIGLDLVLGKSKAAGLAASAPGVAGRLARGTLAGTSGAMAEGATEFAQTLVEEAGKGNDPFSDASVRQAIDASAMGTVGGASMGGAGGILQRAQPKPLALPEPKKGLGAVDITKVPESIGLNNPDVGLDESIKAAWDLLHEDTVAQEHNAYAAQLQAERAAAGPSPEVTIPPVGKDIPLLPGADPVPANTMPLPNPSRLWMDEAVTPGIEVASTFTPRQPTAEDARQSIAAERAKIVAMKANKPAVSTPAPQSTEVAPQVAPTSAEVAPVPSSIDRAYASVPELHELAKAKGLDPDTSIFKEYTKMVTGKSHLDDLTPAERDKLAAKLGRVGMGDASKPAPPASNAETAPAAPFAAPTAAASVPRSELSPEHSADMLLRAEKAQADMGAAGSERGGRYFMEQDGHGSTPEVRGLKSATAPWYKELTKGRNPLKRDQIETAIQKIIQDDGVDVGKAVERVKEALLNDREFRNSPWGEDADAIMRGEWPSWIPKPEGYTPPQPGPAPSLANPSASPTQEGTTPQTQSVEAAPTIDDRAHEAATSPKNDKDEPTEGMKKAGNYELGHDRIAGLNISIENPEGSTRSGKDRDGKPWSVTMKSHYGYIRGTKGKDKEYIDVFVKPNTPKDYSGPVFVVDQKRSANGGFDEHKVMMGYDSIEEARARYKENYAKDWNGIQSIKAFTMQGFKDWLATGDTTQPAGDEQDRIAEQRAKLQEKKAPKAEEKPGQQEIAVPPPTIGERPIIRPEAPLSETPLFSKAAQEPEVEQTKIEDIDQDEPAGPLTDAIIEKAFMRSAHSMAGADARWAERRAKGLTDTDLTEALGYEFGRGGWAKDNFRVEHYGPKSPRIVINNTKTIQGKELLALARKALNIGEPDTKEPASSSFDYTDQGKRPSTKQIMADWKKAGQPKKFDVTYGETFAEFEFIPDGPMRGWQDSGNGAEGVKRNEVVLALKSQTNKPTDAQSDAIKSLLSGRDGKLPEAPKEEKPTAPNAKTQAADKLAKYVDNALGAHKTITHEEFFEHADYYFGGTRASGAYAQKEAYDALELGINRYIARNPQWFTTDATEGQAKGRIGTIRNQILERIPTQKPNRTEDQNEFQQFSTPPDLAFVMNWAANITRADTMLEPSAGIGGIAVFAKVTGARVVMNEYHDQRADLLRQLNIGPVYQENAEQLNNILPDTTRPTVIVMNPPFSSTAGRKQGERSSRNVLRHLDQALARLEPGGRLVALIGQGRDGKDAQFLEEWKKLAGMKYAYRGRIGLSGEGYKKYGTTYDNQILIFDKIKPDGVAPINANVADVLEALPHLLEVRNARTAPTRDNQSASAQSGSQALAEEGGRRDGSQSAVSPAAPAVGSRGERSGPDAGQSPRTESATAPDRGQSPEQSGQGGGTGVSPARPERAPERPATLEPAQLGERPEPGGRLDASPGQPERSSERRPDNGSELPERLAVEQDEAPAPTAPADRTANADAIFESYTPKKVKIKGAKPHPGKLVESSAMSAIDPPDASYQPALPKDVIEEGRLSGAQLEPIVYAGQAHSQLLPDGTRRGFFDGDGTGVGKGREIAGIILDNLRQGHKKAVWLSKNSDLFKDAVRDWKDVAGTDGKELFSQGDMDLGDTITRKDGILFSNYLLLGDGLDLSVDGKLEMRRPKEGAVDRKGNLKKAPTQTRLDQMVNWLGKDYDGVIVFDEAHEMRNNMQTSGARGDKKPAMKALAGIELQKRFPKARIAYFSATGGIEVSDFGYAERLGMWGNGTPFANKLRFVGEIQSGGLAAMELVSQDLKANGLYTSRSLSYDDVTYDRLVHELTADQREMYDEMAKGWQVALQNLNRIMEVTGADKNGGAKSSARSLFWGTHQRFYEQVLTSLQMPTVIKRMEKDLEDGHAIVIQLTKTNAAQQDRQIKLKKQEGGDLDDLDLTPREGFLSYIEKGFPVQEFETYTDENGNERSRPVVDSNGAPVLNKEAVEMRDDLLRRLGSLRTPENPLDLIINTFGAEAVAEVTGRNQRVVRKIDKNGKRTTVTQTGRTKNVRSKEAAEFMDDKRKILVFSDAGGTGQSYHASNRAKNKRRRMHYVIQPGWRADAAMQGLGRTHRSDEASAPHYILVSTDLKGHKRFISTIARRLAQLGALTRGHRQTSSQGLFSEADNLENAYAAGSLEAFFRALKRGDIKGQGWADLLEKLGLNNIVDKNGNIMQDTLPDVPQFLNRILSLEYADQNDVFDAFFERMEAAIEMAKTNGTFDSGMQDYRADSITLKKQQVVYENPETKAKTRLMTFEAKHRLEFHEYKWLTQREKFHGFFIGQKTGKIYAALKGGYQHTNKDGKVEEQIKLLEPDVDKVRMVSDTTFTKNYRKISGKEAEKAWKESIDTSPQTRNETVHILSGAMLGIWDRIGGSTRVYRVTTDDGLRTVGRVIDAEALAPTMERLGVKAEKAEAPTIDKAIEAIENGDTVELANGWKLGTRRVNGEDRIEVMGGNVYGFRDELKSYGAFVESIRYEPRIFVPTENPKPILEKIIRHRPILKITGKSGSADTGLSSNNVSRPNESEVFGDPEPAEARAVESAIEGKTALQAARFIADKAPSASHRALAHEVARKIEELEAAGMMFTLNVAHLNDRVPAALIGTRGLTWLPAGSDSTQVWIQGADVKGVVGVSHEVVLHELTHAATQAALYIGNKSTMADTALGKSVKSLYAVTNAVIAHFNERAMLARRNAATMTPFEKAIFERRANAIQDPGEILAWTFTNPEMQQYLESIPYNGGSLWTRFIEAIRTFLGLSPRNDTALSEVLRLGEELLRTDTNQVVHAFRAAWMPTQVNQYNGLLNADRDVETQSALPDLVTPPYVPATIGGPQQSLLRTQGDLAYQLPAMSKMDDVIRTMQDKNIDLVRLVDTIKAAGNVVHDDLNPVLKEELYLGRVSKHTQDFLTDELRPLVDSMRLNSVTMEQLDEYLHARHAEEANAHLREINPDREDNEALSGMTNEEARRILAEADRPKMDRLAARVDSILANTRRLLVDYGLESQETVNAWMNEYSAYVPLHREGYEDGTPGTGQGRSVRGPQSKARTGSNLKVTNILANVAMDREKAIVRGEKMRPVIALAGLLQQYPNSDIATLTKPAMITYTNPDTGLLEMAPGDIGEYRVPMLKGINRKTGEVEFRPDPNYKGRDNVVNFRLAGVDHSIVFNEHNDRTVQMARALKDLDVGQLNTVLASVAPATRYLASINTQFNPVFGVVNFIRDIQFAMLALGTTPLAGKRAEVRNATFKAIKGIYQDARAIRRGEHPTSPVAQLWERFQRVGGPTGYRDMFRGSNDRAKAIEHMLNPDWWQKTLGGKILTAGGRLGGVEQAILDKAAKPLFEWLSDYNQAMENAVRLGVFQVGLENGMSDEQAASAAKNITVNFNKKGQITTQVGALYAFFNASVQGTARIAETLFEKGEFGKLSDLGKKIIQGGTALGALQAFALSMAGFEDEEPPEWMKSRSLIIPVPGTDRGYVAIPMPLGFNILPNFGRLVAESLIHGKPIERAYQFLSTFVDAFSPVGGAATMSQFLAPTAVDPFVALSENKDWTGRKIYREDFNSLKPTPGMTRAKDTASPWAKGLAEAINWATGGTEYTPGHFSPTPDSIDYLVAQMTGGVGRETSKASQALSGLVSGEEVPMHKIPLVGRLVGSASDVAARRNAFYDNLREVSMHGEEVEGRRRHHEDPTDYVREHPDARLSVYAGQVEREVQHLNRRKRDLLREGASSDRVRLVEMQIDRVMDRFNDRVKQLQAAQ